MVDNDLPRSVAIIPDGNRRYSSSHKIQMMKGYDIGINKAIDVSLWLKDLGIKELSIWALSTENIKNRSKMELNLLYKLYKKTALSKSIFNKLSQNNVKVCIIGNMGLIPKDVKDALYSLQSKTSKFKDIKINLLIAYGGRDDILTAVKKIVKDKAEGKISRINESLLHKYLISSSITNPDLIIRTSGEFRSSGLLPWQSVYSEFYFTKKYWPELDKKDIEEAIKEYSNRKRRFGK